MKKLISVLLVLSIISGLFAMCGVTAFAANNILNYISYEINDGEVTITDCDESISGDVVIPDTIEGYPVITILYDAFADCDGITSVYISENIREDYEIFNFFYCGFGSNIEKYIVDEKNKNFSSDDSGVVYNKDKTVLFRYPCGSDSSEFVIPESVEKIGAGAFMDCYSLIGVTIPYGVELIEAQAFMSCTSLQYIEVPDDTILDYSVFYGCTSLEEAVIGRSEGLSDSLFYGCSNLENVKINTRVISGAAFDSCCNLKNVEFGTNVNKIESGVFNYCESLEEIYIPASVTEIEEAAFYLTKELKNIIVDENNPAYASENGMLLNKDKTKLIYVPYKNEYVHDIPESVTTVGTAAYYVFIDAEINLTNIEIIEPSAYIYCFEADEIVIPESVNHIMLYAFGSCCFAKDIYIYNPDVQIDEKSIGYCEFEVLVEKDEFIEIFKKYFFEPNEEDRETYYAEFENSISYYEDMLPIPGVTIHGYAGSTAEAYANEHGFNFVELEAEPDSLFTYEIVDDEVIITGCDKSVSGDLVIPDTIEGYPVTTIAFGAFEDCFHITSIYIPANLKIFEDLGSVCIGLEKFLVDPDNSCFSSDADGVLYNKDKTVLIRYPIGKTETEYTVADSVTEIADMAIFCAMNLESIQLPDCITTIGELAFAQCFRLKNINIPTEIKTLNPMAFYLSFSIESMVFPESAASVYDCLKYSLIKDIYCYNSEMDIAEFEIGYSYFDLSAITADGNSIEYLAENAVAGFLYGVTGNGDPVEIEIGKYADFMNIFPHPDFTIHGYAGSTAEAYANEHGFNFVLIDSHNYVDTVITPATYTQAGVGGMVCDHCGDVQSTYEIPMLEIEESEEKVDKDTGVSVVFPEGTFDGEAQIEVTPVEDGEAYYKLISHKEGNYKVTMFDINVTVDGQKVQPNGTVLVQIPLPKGYNQNKCVVYYVADDGTMEELKTYHNKDGYVYFETTHFSYYAILEETTETDNSTENENELISYLRGLLNKYIAAFLKFIDMIKSLFGMK